MDISGQTTDLVLRVRDAAEVGHFYEEVLGLRRLEDFESDARVAYGIDTPVVWLEEDAGAAERPRDAAGLFHLAIRVPEGEALSEVLRRFERRGYPLQGASDHLVSATALARPRTGSTTRPGAW
jgi:catechol 2,3-dioxygenase